MPMKKHVELGGCRRAVAVDLSLFPWMLRALPGPIISLPRSELLSRFLTGSQKSLENHLGLLISTICCALPLSTAYETLDHRDAAHCASNRALIGSWFFFRALHPAIDFSTYPRSFEPPDV